MKSAYNYADCSTAVRLKVGAIIVKDDAIISIGYNGQPKDWDNVCESKEWMSPDAGGWMDPDEVETAWPFVATSDTDGAYIGRYRLVTKPTVLHAERNALDKLTKGTGGANNACMFVTHAPCLECAKSIHGAGIKEVYYSEIYRCTDGLEYLEKCGIPAHLLTITS